jgi:REP element-mobilizing transposase RayT
VKSARAKGLAISHFAILSNHVHLIVEPRSSSLRAEMQSLCISLAKRLNAVARRTGAVFQGRYHLHVLRTPTEVRRALNYVLTNEAHHRLRGGARKRKLTVRVDPFSSAFSFKDWKILFGARVELLQSAWSDDWVEAWLSEILQPPSTWLLTRGWKARRS